MNDVGTAAPGWIRPTALTLFLACLVTAGGSSSGAFYANAVLQVLSCGVIAWAVWDSKLRRLRLAAWIMLAFALVFATMMLVQLAPLPADLWTQLPGRQIVVDGFEALGRPLPSLPLTLTPDETVFGLIKFLPALAAFVIAARLSGAELAASLPWAVLGCGVASVIVGLGQIFLGADAPLYLYEFTNRGLPVGFMANANHQATFLVMTLPFGALIISRMVNDAHAGSINFGRGIILWVLLAVIVLGVLMAGSVAGYALLAPSVLLSILIARGSSSGRITTVVIVAVSLGLAILGAIVASSPRLVGLGATDLSDDYLSRPDTYRRTFEAIGDTMPVGTGLGSFQAVFPAYEDPQDVTSTYMNHAHNDYLEFVLEFGLAGAILIALVVGWIAWRSVVVWSEDAGQGARLRKAASVALLLVVVHSVVDYPLRTAAISGFAGLCLGLMATRPEAKRSRRASTLSEKPRHVVI